MNFKNCRALNSILAALLITQMVVLVPVARADENGELSMGSPEAPTFTTVKLPSAEKPAAEPAEKPAAEKPAPADKPAAAAPVAGSEETKAYCYKLDTVQDDQKKIKGIYDELTPHLTTHIQLTTEQTYGDLVAAPKSFFNDYAKPLLSKEQAGVCNYKRKAEENVAKANAKLVALSNAPQGQGSCPLANNLYDFVREASIDQRAYVTLVQIVRNGPKDDHNNSKGKGLIQYFSEGATKDEAAIRAANQKMMENFKTIKPGQKTLDTEFTEIWGANADKKKGEELQKPMGSPAIYSKILDALYYEEKNAVRLENELKGMVPKYSDRFKNCGLGDPTAPKAPKSGEINPNNRQQVLSKDGKPDPGVSGDDIKSEVDKEKEKNAALREKIDNRDALRAEKRRGVELEKKWNEDDKYTKRDPDDGDTSTSRDRSRARRGEAPEEPIKDFKMPDTSKNHDSTASNFLSDNAGLLVGGALVVGGGTAYYLWDKSEKKKKQDEWDAYWASVQPTGSTSTSTAVDTSHRLMNRSAITNAVAGMTLPPMQVAITDANGNTLTGQDVDITMSCVNPIPCSLTGTTIVRSVNGVATFSDVRFINPHVGVRLRYSTSWGGIEQSNGFDVTANGTSTATVTSTGTSTGTGTSTSTAIRQ
ncbi:MAG: hypothetical protein ACXVBE_03700 [Bdellovibrionota bacterium]